jgi:catechol 2,3-dioxygenase-like lactoylglutathione lyase family enzyme
MNALPGLRGVEHVAFTVPDLDAAVRFFVDVLGCEHFYDMGPFADPEGTWMSDNLDVHPRSLIPKFAVLRCANGANFEIFQYESPDQVERWPRMSDWGGTHIAFYVDDIDAALARLEAHGVRVLGGRKDGIGPESGANSSFAHFLTPWGQLLELVSYPNGRDYQRDTGRTLWRPL